MTPSSRGRRGSVRRDPERGTWKFTVDVSAPGEKRRQILRRGFTTKREAVGALDDLLAEHEVDAPVSSTTVSAFITEWLTSIRSTVKPTTAEGYRQKLAHVDRVLGDRDLSSIEPADIRELHRDLFERDLSAQSVRHVHKVWGRALRDAERWELVASNPVRKVDPPRAEHREQEAWTVDEVRAFFEAVAGDRLRGLWVLMATTGLRRSEALGLRWDDVDLEVGRLSVQRAVTTAGHEVHIGDPKTKSSRRGVALDEGTVTELRAHRARQASERLMMGAGWADEAWVFAEPTGQLPHPNVVYRRFKRAVKAAGLRDISLHGLRHTSASALLTGGAHPKVVQSRLGHTDIRTTLDTYSHLVEGLDEEAADTIGGMFFRDHERDHGSDHGGEAGAV